MTMTQKYSKFRFKRSKILNFSDQKQSIRFDIVKLQEAYNQIINKKN